MRTLASSRFIAAAVSAVAGVLPATASACSVCMGDPGTKAGGAINGAIFLMLGFVAVMLSLVAAFAFHLKKLAKSPIPPHAELSAIMAAQEDAN